MRTGEQKSSNNISEIRAPHRILGSLALSLFYMFWENGKHVERPSLHQNRINHIVKHFILLFCNSTNYSFTLLILKNPKATKRWALQFGGATESSTGWRVWWSAYHFLSPPGPSSALCWGLGKTPITLQTLKLQKRKRIPILQISKESQGG